MAFGKITASPKGKSTCKSLQSLDLWNTSPRSIVAAQVNPTGLQHPQDKAMRGEGVVGLECISHRKHWYLRSRDSTMNL
ncbi:hypothetical protein J1614_012241 [Plenodomus biglobosus]|nr:hypothetical protein J1614_012241 [Plenodomus biglobosus]